MMPVMIAAVFAIFSLCVLPLAIGAESYAQMLVIFNKFYNDIIKIKLRKRFNILKSK